MGTKPLKKRRSVLITLLVFAIGCSQKEIESPPASAAPPSPDTQPSLPQPSIRAVPVDQSAKAPVGEKPTAEGLETAAFLGITFARATDAWTQYYGHGKTDWILVVDPGKEAERLGLTGLVPGSALRSITDVNQTRMGSGHFSPLAVGWSVLECLEKHPTQDAYQCQIGFKKPNAREDASGVVTATVTLTPADVAALREAFRPLTICGVTFEHITAAARKQYNLPTSFAVMVSDPGTPDERVGMKGLRKGDAIQMVSSPGRGEGVFHPVDLGNKILALLASSGPDQSVRRCGLSIARNFDPATGRWESVELELKLGDAEVKALEILVSEPRE